MYCLLNPPGLWKIWFCFLLFTLFFFFLRAKLFLDKDLVCAWGRGGQVAHSFMQQKVETRPCPRKRTQTLEACSCETCWLPWGPLRLSRPLRQDLGAPSSAQGPGGHLHHPSPPSHSAVWLESPRPLSRVHPFRCPLQSSPSVYMPSSLLKPPLLLGSGLSLLEPVGPTSGHCPCEETTDPPALTLQHPSLGRP